MILIRKTSDNNKGPHLQALTYFLTSKPYDSRLITYDLVTVHFSLVWAFLRNTQVACLLVSQLFQLCTYLSQVKACNLLIKVLRKNVYFVLIVGVVLPQFYLRQCLVAE